MATSGHGLLILNSVSKFQRSTFGNKSYIVTNHNKTLYSPFCEIVRRCLIPKSNSEACLPTYVSGVDTKLQLSGDVTDTDEYKHVDSNLDPTNNVNYPSCSRNNKVTVFERDWYQTRFPTNSNSDGRLDKKRPRSSSYLGTPAVNNDIASDNRPFIPILKSTSCDVLRVISARKHETTHERISKRSALKIASEQFFNLSETQISSSTASNISEGNSYPTGLYKPIKLSEADFGVSPFKSHKVDVETPRYDSNKMSQRNGIISTTLYSALEMKRCRSLTGLLSVVTSIKLPSHSITRKYTQQSGSRFENRFEKKRKTVVKPLTLSPQSPSDKWFKSNSPPYDEFRRSPKSRKHSFVVNTVVEFNPQEKNPLQDNLKQMANKFLNPLINTVACSKLIIQEMRRLAKANKSSFTTRKTDGKKQLQYRKVKINPEQDTSPIRKQENSNAIAKIENENTQYAQNIPETDTMHKDVMTTNVNMMKSQKPVKKYSYSSVQSSLSKTKEMTEQNMNIPITARSNITVLAKWNKHPKLKVNRTITSKTIHKSNPNYYRPETKGQVNEFNNQFTIGKLHNPWIIHGFTPKEDSKHNSQYNRTITLREKPSGNSLFDEILQRKAKIETEKYKPRKQTHSSKRHYRPVLKHDKQSYFNALSKTSPKVQDPHKSINPFTPDPMQFGIETLQRSSTYNKMVNQNWLNQNNYINNTSGKNSNEFQLYSSVKHYNNQEDMESYRSNRELQHDQVQQDLKSFSASEIYKQTSHEKQNFSRNKQNQIKSKVDMLNNWTILNEPKLEHMNNYGSNKHYVKHGGLKLNKAVEFKGITLHPNSPTNIMPEVRMDPEEYYEYFVSKSRKAKYFNEGNAQPKNRSRPVNITKTKQKNEIKTKRGEHSASYRTEPFESYQKEPDSYHMSSKYHNTINSHIDHPSFACFPPVQIETKHDNQTMTRSKRMSKMPESYRQFMNSAQKRLAKKKSNININADVRRQYKTNPEKDSYLDYFTKGYNDRYLSKGKDWDFENEIDANYIYDTNKKTVARSNAVQLPVTEGYNRINNQEDVIDHFSQKRHMYRPPLSKSSVTSESRQTINAPQVPLRQERHYWNDNANIQAEIEHRKRNRNRGNSSFVEGDFTITDNNSTCLINNDSIDVNLPKVPVIHWYDEISSVDDVAVSAPYKSVFVEHARTYFNKG